MHCSRPHHPMQDRKQTMAMSSTSTAGVMAVVVVAVVAALAGCVGGQELDPSKYPCYAKLKPCLEGGDDDAPSKACCVAFGDVVGNDLACLCSLAAASGANSSDVLDVAKTCGVATAGDTLCAGSPSVPSSTDGGASNSGAATPGSPPATRPTIKINGAHKVTFVWMASSASLLFTLMAIFM